MSAMDERTEQETGFFDGNESYQVHYRNMNGPSVTTNPIICERDTQPTSLVFCLFEQHVDPANVDTQTTHMADHGSGKRVRTRCQTRRVVALT
jgi:hypothetical protein